MTMIIVPMVVIVAVVRVRVLVITLLAMENQEIHAERVEGGNKHPASTAKLAKPAAGKVLRCTASMMLSLE